MELITQKYRWMTKTMNTLAQNLAAIQKLSPQFEVFFKFENLIVENFFKYKRFRDVTENMVEEVYKPFIATSLKEANISNENIALCGQDTCQSDLTLAQSWLWVPIELMKYRKFNFLILHILYTFEIASNFTSFFHKILFWNEELIKLISSEMPLNIGAGHFLKFAFQGDGVSPRTKYKDFIRFRSYKHF